MKTYPTYKDSGIQWIGEIPEHWDRIRIKNLVAIKVTDGPHETPEWKLEGIPFISAEAIKGNQIDLNFKRGFISNEQHFEYCKKSKVSKNDILFCKSGSTTGKSALVEIDEEFGIWSPLAIIRADEKKVGYKYLFHSIQSSLFKNQVETSWTFGTQPNIGMGALENLWISIPPLPEQTHIAKYLDHKTSQIDDLIAKKERLIKLLQEERTAMINQAVTKGLDPNVSMKDSGIEWLGEIPEHWEVKMLKFLTTQITNGFVGPTRDLYYDNGVRYIQSLHIKLNKIDFKRSPYYVSQEWSNNHPRSILKSGDILVVQTGAVGEVALVSKDYDGCNCHALIIVRSDNSKIKPEYLLYQLESSYGKSIMKQIETGALHPHINSTKLKDIIIVAPILKEQTKIVEFILKEEKRIKQTIELTQQEIKLLQEYKTALISEVVTGKVDVREEVLT